MRGGERRRGEARGGERGREEARGGSCACEVKQPTPPSEAAPGRTASQHTLSRIYRALSRSAPREPAAGDASGAPPATAEVLLGALSRPSLPAPALQAIPGAQARLHRILGPYPAGSRRATSRAGSLQAARSKSRPSHRRAWRAAPVTSRRSSGSQAYWRLCRASTRQKTPHSARDVTGSVRPAAARAPGRHAHRAHARWAHACRQEHRGSKEDE